VIRTANQRALVACGLLALCFTGFSFRLVHLQVTMHDVYVAKATHQNTHREPIFARRGAIIDIRGEPLAQNEPVKTVIADASLIKDRTALAALLAKPLDLPASKLRERLGKMLPAKDGAKELPSRYIVLKKDVPETKATEIAQLMAGAKKDGLIEAAGAIRFEQDSVRVYPNGSMLCHVLGYLNGEGRGMDGIEATMNAQLAGKDGFRCIERDRTGREMVPYRGQDRAPQNGSTVRLTIDMGLQQIVENELDAALKQFKPKKATVILMNPKTGEIMALANRPQYDLNDQEGVKPAQRNNIAVTDQVEPGSTFKIVTVAAALSEGIVHPDTEVFCENGYWNWCKLRDHHPYSSLTVDSILVKSSNIGVAKIGMQLGEAKLYEYVRRFGFGTWTSVNLPGEIRGRVAPPYEWDKITITRMPMGQSVAATPLQIVTAMSAIANGGTLMVPQIIRDVVGEEGRTDNTPQEIHRVVSKKAAQQVRDALIQVVGPKGTAALARVAGFKVAGKTGTAQKLDENGHMSHEKYVVSFVGYMPAEDPAFVALVLLDEAQVKHSENYGGLVAAPVFSRIAEKAARYLNLQPTEDPTPAGGVISKNESGRDQ
jgi:cell division protein FtsI (penicillin-binding protein 3)/stage V sporulation protein D (sporulation-specific penicillin-binding protein)